ncbi:hypothetical protein DSO57_1007168 [Entomophthora muscae]|uniref:Uncharacterized protein n=1 Tax=Entomophthora muscae TaxID=34485 RepID=A0ACC2U5F3_9FUNG|nr:hypothetical protein DSO57_1007168 [Entomophthora muscae]
MNLPLTPKPMPTSASEISLYNFNKLFEKFYINLLGGFIPEEGRNPSNVEEQKDESPPKKTLQESQPSKCSPDIPIVYKIPEKEQNESTHSIQPHKLLHTTGPLGESLGEAKEEARKAEELFYHK